jgi:hypothetical protein
MDELLVMRLADMHRVHPEQDNSRVCACCGEQVGIFPSGQRALRFAPTLKIVCNVCAERQPRPVVRISAPGALDEARESVPKDKQRQPDDEREPDPADEYAQAFDNKCR